MVRGQKHKTLTGRGPSATGRRKNAKSVDSLSPADENDNPARPPTSTPGKAYPKPRPLKKAVDDDQNGEATAARALVTLQNGNRANSPPINRYFRAAVGLPKGTNLDPSSGEEDYEEDVEDEVDELGEDSEEEIDELQDSDDSGKYLLLPTGSPVRRPKLPEFKVPFVVPFRNASRNVDGITSKTAFSGVLHRLSDHMEVGVTHLSGIGYIPSYLPKASKPRPVLLEDSASWYKLLEDAHSFIESCKGKSGKGAIKPFSINIVDTTAPGDSTDLKKKKKPAAMEAPSQPALSSKEAEQLSGFKKLEQHYMCQQHKKACLVQADGEHYQLTVNDLTKWAHLMADNKALLDTPPDALKLTDFVPRQYAAKKAMAKSQAEVSNGAPEWLQQLMGVLLVGNIASSNRTMLANTPMTPAPSEYHIPSTPRSPLPTLKRPGLPLAYPTLEVWLESLENDPTRQKKAQGYRKLLPFFMTNGIEDLEDLLHLTSDEMMKIIPEINIGTAKRILAFAQEDAVDLRDRKRPHLV